MAESSYPELFEVMQSALRKLVRGERALGIREVMRRTGLSRPRIYQLIKDGDFPPSRKTRPDADRGSFWLESDIDRWLRSRPRSGPRPL